MANDQHVRAEAVGSRAERAGRGLHDREVGRPGEVGDAPVAETGEVGQDGLDSSITRSRNSPGSTWRNRSSAALRCAGLGYLIGLTMGQQRFLKTLGIRHGELGTARLAGLALDIARQLSEHDAGVAG